MNFQNSEILENVLLAPYTTWRIGGPAQFFAQPKSVDELSELLAQTPKDMPITWIGLGSNLLVRDGGIPGLVIHTRGLDLMTWENDSILAQAGVTCAKLARFSCQHDCKGGEFFAGIPGTLGGALAMNAGAFGGETWPVIEQVTVIDRKGVCHRRTPLEFDIGYRKAKNLVSNEEFFVAAHIRLEQEQGYGKKALEHLRGLIKKRNQTQPIGTFNCGSVFRNPPNHHAAALIEACQLKGKRIGGALICEKHANFILNNESASSDDIECLIELIQTNVREKFGIELEPEVRIVGQTRSTPMSKPILCQNENFFAYPRSFLHSKDVSSQQFGKVAVLLGGNSGEREVSLESGKNVLEALQRKGVDAHALDARGDFVKKLIEQKFDRVFIALHGKHGEDGCVQGALESLNLPYTGSGVASSALAMDKARSKIIMDALGLPTPNFGIAYHLSQAQDLTEQIGFPVAVKPISEGSSLGTYCVESREALQTAFEDARQYGPVLVEHWVRGRDVFVTVLGDEVLPSVEVEPIKGFYDYHAKYQSDDTQYHCPARLSKENEEQVRHLAKRAFYALGCEGWGRVDFVIDSQNNPWVLEVNTIPGMTSHSLVPMSAKASGLSYDDLVLTVLATTLVAQGIQETTQPLSKAGHLE